MFHGTTQHQILAMSRDICVAMSTMSEGLRNARIAAGYASAKDAATRFGWNRSTYTAHENGQNDYNIDWERKYGEAFGLSAHVLLFGGTIIESQPQPVDADFPSIDQQLRELPPEASRELIDEFNTMIRGARAVLKKLRSNA